MWAVTASDWDKPYSREKAAYPAVGLLHLWCTPLNKVTVILRNEAFLCYVPSDNVNLPIVFTSQLGGNQMQEFNIGSLVLYVCTYFARCVACVYMFV